MKVVASSCCFAATLSNQGWLKSLKEDKTLIVQVAEQAQKATDFIFGQEGSKSKLRHFQSCNELDIKCVIRPAIIMLGRNYRKANLYVSFGIFRFREITGNFPRVHPFKFENHLFKRRQSWEIEGKGVVNRIKNVFRFLCLRHRARANTFILIEQLFIIALIPLLTVMHLPALAKSKRKRFRKVSDFKQFLAAKAFFQAQAVKPLDLIHRAGIDLLFVDGHAQFTKLQPMNILVSHSYDYNLYCWRFGWKRHELKDLWLAG